MNRLVIPPDKSIISQTFVTYETNDVLGFIFGHFTLIPIYILVMYVTLILTRRDFHTVFTLGGQIVCLVVNKLLKVIIDEPRPVDSDLNDSGMPSNHSQFMFFFAFFYALQFLFRKESIGYLSLLERIFFSITLCIMAIVVCYSRIYLSNHTPEQVIVGSIVGGLMGVAWFIFDILYGDAIGNIVCSIPVIRWLGFRNYSCIENYHRLRSNPDLKKDQ